MKMFVAVKPSFKFYFDSYQSKTKINQLNIFWRYFSLYSVDDTERFYYYPILVK